MASFHRQTAFNRLPYYLLVLTLLVSVGTSHSITNRRNTVLEARSCKDKGECKDDYVWSFVADAEDVMYTCCPEDYIAMFAPAAGLPSLDTFFCCPKDTKNGPCPSKERELPSTPFDCPCKSDRQGVSCVGGNLDEPDNAQVA